MIFPLIVKSMKPHDIDKVVVFCFVFALFCFVLFLFCFVCFFLFFLTFDLTVLYYKILLILLQKQYLHVCKFIL